MLEIELFDHLIMCILMTDGKWIVSDILQYLEPFNQV